MNGARESTATWRPSSSLRGHSGTEGYGQHTSHRRWSLIVVYPNRRDGHEGRFRETGTVVKDGSPCGAPCKYLDATKLTTYVDRRGEMLHL
ncbi:hypothetical protein R1flu_018911 [Riccia fluitans]|uniref:Uncharacterized protein n=1 Tax=Riccia fluitans TaxID=41844 RepID=A0ABD1ZH69_9MARC